VSNLTQKKLDSVPPMIPSKLKIKEGMAQIMQMFRQPLSL